ncbi:MAG: TraV family lipoprotein [Burkholderiales bacterium]|jgi:conjugal transfer pilus assembly protein TraV|nr:TraV family lipoprotein [Burkholderiales bacterium]
MNHTFRSVAVIATAGLSLLASGCANITGLEGKSSYSCKAPDGVQCDSVSGNYYNSVQNNLPSQRRSPTSRGGIEAPATAPTHQEASLMVSTAARTTAPAEPAAYNAAPLRAAPRVMRLWIKPWEDADRDLNGEALVYVQVDNGRWLVEHVQQQAREPFAPVRAGKLPAATTAKAGPQAPADDGTSITQALRALQQRSANQADN